MNKVKKERLDVLLIERGFLKPGKMRNGILWQELFW